MKIDQKIMLAAGALVSLVLLVQGAVSQINIRKELKSAAVRHLTGELKTRIQLLNDLLRETEQDLSAMQAHKAFEDYFTSKALDDSDGMLDSEFELESFFIRIIRAKPQYTRIQLLTAAGEPVLQIAGDRRIERFDRNNLAEKLEQFSQKLADTPKERLASFSVIHDILQDEKAGWMLLTVGALIFNKNIEGFLWVKQPIDSYIEQIFSGLSTDGISYTISSKDGIPVAHSMNVSPETLTGLLKGELSGWVIASEAIPDTALKVTLGIEKAKAFEVMNNLLLIGIGIWVSAVLVSMLLLGIIARNISRPIKSLVDWAARLSKGDLTIENIKISNDEIGKLNAAYREVVNSFKEVASVCEDISNGDLSRSLDIKSDKDVLGKSVNRMISTLRKVTAENEKVNWLKTGQAELNNRMRGEQDIATLSQNIISYLAAYLDAQIGAIYVADENKLLKLTGTYAYKKQKNFYNEYRFGEGLAGQAALEKEIILTTNVPDGYINIHSGLGKAAPHNIVVVPLLYEGKVKGVLELGSFHEITDVRLDLLRQVSENIAISLNSAQSRLRMKELLKETQSQAEELETRQEELRQTNEELEEQTHTLEKQQDDLKKKNTELEKAREVIEQKARELETSNKYKSQFLANMSHELRTPLNSLLLLSKLLMENKDGNLTDKQVDFAKTIHIAGSDLLDLINDILDLSKIEAGKMELNPDNLEIDDFLSYIERNFRHMAQEKRVSLKIDRADGLPAYIRTDRQKLEQIIKNLLSNALKFTSQGGIIINIRRPGADVDLSNSGLDISNAVAIAVSDTGIGIPEDKQKLIFEAFKQVDGTTSRQYGGTGLGLSISRELAKFLGGEIRLQSIEGKGSTFTLYLPERLGKADKEEARIVVSLGGKDTGVHKNDMHINDRSVSKDISFDKPFELEDIRDDRRNISPGDKTILIIEDDPTFAKILYNLALENGFKGLIAGDGEAGLHLADYYRPGAVILDICLPRMDGWTVMERLRDNPGTCHIPVHFMSVCDKSPEAMQMGAIGYLTKPVSMEKLNKAFRKIRKTISGTMKDLLIAEDDDVEADLPEDKQKMPRMVCDKEDVFKDKKILLTDDDMRSAFALSNLLEERGMKVLIGKNGREALECLDKNPDISLVLMDIMMSEMDGYEAMREIRKQEWFRKLPVIALTAKAMRGDREKCIDAGASDYLAKPVDVDKLLSFLRVWMQRQDFKKTIFYQAIGKEVIPLPDNGVNNERR
ncbi:MAG TPA: response regulator [Nitrospirae bacterium]|nr:sensory/regulatory protein RpfC [bacterium BMS3Abin06]HDH12164.1 response regulator [Nitrospirota bacterium]HDZ02145.1 response regulator [Nitrospirota bacterium]